MKAARLFTVAIVLAVLASISLTTAYAQAYDVAFTTSITYQNVGDATAHIVAQFYESPDDTTPIEIARPDLAQDASTSLYIGGLSEIADGFRGSATLLSDQPLLATTVQLPQGSAIVKNRPLSNGFTQGAPQVLVATVLKNTFSTNSVFSIQNTGSSESTLTLHFYNTSATEVYSDTQTVQPGAAYLFDAGVETGLGSSFNGSAVVMSTDDIVGSVMELSTNAGGTACSAFEGVAAGAQRFYMPSALCQGFGADTAYAVQNTSLSASTVVTVTYSNGASETQTIDPGAKKSFIACNAAGMPTGFSGSATIDSSATDVIAIGKAYGSGLSTAFVGASSRSSKVALPYVRWGTDADYAAGAQQRTFITVQNIGSADLAAGDVTVRYIKYDGSLEGTPHSLGAIPVRAKVNSNASNAGLSSFGIYGSIYGGGAIVEGPSGSQLAVVARVSTQVSPGTFASEDYNGMTAP
jgi:hypothetical protein